MVLGSRMFFDSVKFQQLPVDPHPYSEIVGLRVFGFLLWCAGTLWIFVLLRARHAVTLSIMLVLEAQRAMHDIGSIASWVTRPL